MKKRREESNMSLITKKYDVENEYENEEIDVTQQQASSNIIHESMIQDEGADNDQNQDRRSSRSSFEISAASSSSSLSEATAKIPWLPSGTWWKDMLYFVGPGWLVSIAYIDPGKYQADIQAGATTQYYLLFPVWWSSVLSIYVQVLCVRLGYFAQQTLAEVQANEFQQLAKFSVILTDLPEVIGIGIACNLFFGWPYWIGVLMSLVTAMLFLGTMQYGMYILDWKQNIVQSVVMSRLGSHRDIGPYLQELESKAPRGKETMNL